MGFVFGRLFGEMKTGGVKKSYSDVYEIEIKHSSNYPACFELGIKTVSGNYTVKHVSAVESKLPAYTAIEVLDLYATVTMGVGSVTLHFRNPVKIQVLKQATATCPYKVNITV
jgi:hypothetical protein